jgi:hypothetical protein
MNHTIKVRKIALAILLALPLCAPGGAGEILSRRDAPEQAGVLRQRMIVTWMPGENRGTQTLVVQSLLEGEGDFYGLVIPVPTVPTDFGVADEAVFDAAAKACGSSGSLSPEEELRETWCHDVCILGNIGLRNWMRQNRLTMSSGMQKGLLPYVDEKRWRLLAMTFRRKGAGQSVPRALHATFETPHPFVPMVTTLAGASTPALDVYAAGDGPAAIEGLTRSASGTVTSAACDLLDEDSNMAGVLQKGMMVTRLEGTIKGDARHLEVEYAENAPADSETQQ